MILVKLVITNLITVSVTTVLGVKYSPQLHLVNEGIIPSLYILGFLCLKDDCD